MTEKKKTPDIRFKGFSGDWVEHYLEDVVDIVDGDRGKNYPNVNDFNENGHTLFLSAANITKYGFSFESSQFITENKSESLGNGKLQLDDIVLTSRGSLGHVAWYSKIIQEKVPFARINSGMLLLRSKGYIAPNFIEQFLKSPIGQKQIDLISFGSAQPQLTKKDIGIYNVCLPDNVCEQVAIASFFFTLDNLIAIQQRKYNKTENMKKACLEKMFPKKSAKVPEVRFAGFSGDWVENTLEDVSEIIMGQSPKGENYTENPNDFILVQGNADMLNGRVVPRIWTTQVTKVANKGDLLMSVRAPVGEIGKTDYDIVIGRGVAAIKGNEFIFQSLKRMNDFGYWKSLSCGSTFESINSDVLKKAILFMPDEDEQTKIGEYFRQLDNLIALYAQELEKLKNIKKACLKKMFI